MLTQKYKSVHLGLIQVNYKVFVARGLICTSAERRSKVKGKSFRKAYFLGKGALTHDSRPGLLYPIISLRPSVPTIGGEDIW